MVFFIVTAVRPSDLIYSFLIEHLICKNYFQILLCVENLPSRLRHIKEGKAIPVTYPGGPLGCEMSRIPHFLDNRLTDGGEVVSLTRRPLFTPRKIPGTHLCHRLSQPQGHSAARRIR
jgi:hypothetical protein